MDEEGVIALKMKHQTKPLISATRRFALIFTALNCKGCADAHKVTQERKKKQKSRLSERVFHDFEMSNVVDLASKRDTSANRKCTE